MIIKQNQSTLDLATQINGDPRAVLDFCIANGFSITEELTAGTEALEYETSFNEDVVVEFFNLKEINLATSQLKAIEEPLGIGTMIINTNFDIT